MNKTVHISISLKGDWTDEKKIETIKRLENIPSDAICLGMYSETVDETKLFISYDEESEVNNND